MSLGRITSSRPENQTCTIPTCLRLLPRRKRREILGGPIPGRGWERIDWDLPAKIGPFAPNSVRISRQILRLRRDLEEARDDNGHISDRNCC